MLKGVAGFLFVPMAKAVVFAMIASFILSRTLVPTMAMYPPEAARPRRRIARGRRPRTPRNAVQESVGGFPARLHDPLRSLPRGLPQSSRHGARPPARVRHRIPGRRRRLVPARAVPRRKLLPDRRFRSDHHARASAGRHAHRERLGDVRRYRAHGPRDDPAQRAGLDRRQHRPADELDQHRLQQHRPHRLSGRRRLCQPPGRSPSDGGVCEAPARDLAGRLSGRDLLLPRPPTSSARSSISARRRRSTSRLPGRTRKAIRPTRWRFCGR